MQMELEKPRMNYTASTSGKTIKFVVEPLERGFGHTLGNMLRRVLLSSLPGVAVTGVKIDGVPHEFTTIKGVVEDVTDIVLNLKGLVLKTTNPAPDFKGILRVRGKKPGPIFARDIETSADIEICNPDHLVLTIDNNKELFMEIYVGKGRGYASAAEHRTSQDTIGLIAIDSLYSPVEKVNYFVEAARVGQKIDYDKLTLEVTTNGAINAKEVVSLAARLAQDHLQIFVDMVTGMAKQSLLIDRQEDHKIQLLSMSIEDLELSPRSSNCLKRASINTIEDLTSKTKTEMMRVRNLGSKSLDEIIVKLEQLGLYLKAEEEEEGRQ